MFKYHKFKHHTYPQRGERELGNLINERERERESLTHRVQLTARVSENVGLLSDFYTSPYNQ